MVVEEYAGKRAEQEARITEDKINKADVDYEYYVEVQNGDSVRASEIQRLNLEQLRYPIMDNNSR